MLQKHISSEIANSFEYTPTESQKQLIEKLSVFISTPNIRQIFILKGYAGTGKTSIISAMVKTLSIFKINCELLAPTGRAAKVFSSFAHKKAYTIHKKIYRQQSSKDGFGTFVLNKNLHKDTFFLVDEASMISNESYENSIFGSGRLLEDLLEYINEGNNCKLILIGDGAQLPPVKLSISPALDKDFFAFHNYQIIEHTLNDVVRQTLDSGILYNATKIRNQIENKNENFPKIEIERFDDIETIIGSEVVEKISNAYDKFGLENTTIICRSNKQANIYNNGIRSQILYHEEEISVGDYLMIVKNNYYWAEILKLEEHGVTFIANGDTVKIRRVKNIEEIYGFRFANISIELIDYDNIEIDVKILLDALQVNSASLTSEQNKALFYGILEDYQDLKPKKKQYDAVKENPYFNALQVKFAYAITGHKSQGGQWKNAFIDHGYIPDNKIDAEFLRWLYTAFTRPTEKLQLVNFNKLFF
ncbi:MAG TPA: ATP-dependent endonuclease [Bacteroidales bacterium]|nr:MAG: ATP-dependent endonuclease [Bacteroidetes bacterium GWF2_33_38]OFY72874.1 MAG: ATP-dependent endonuclease [Bacteroidetes bacterium RIFOXYA12_FULL_33_9]HBF87042.1 ATP-dependent endonuclease [Bacteroidales bacterium]